MINRDYKTDVPSGKVASRISRAHWLLLMAGITLPALFLIFSSNKAEAIRASGEPQSTISTIPTSIIPLTLPADLSKQTMPAQEVGIQTPQDVIEKMVTVKKGDALSTIFSRLDLDQGQLLKVVNSGKDATHLKRLMPGQQLHFQLDNNHQLLQLVYQIDTTTELKISRHDSGYQAHLELKTPERRHTYARGTINNSLFLAGQAAGLSDELIMELANIFAWDVDFALDIRENDQFSLVYEELYLDGKKIGNGEILAADFTNQGRTFRALRYTGPDQRADYFTPEGRSVRKAFLRSPVDFRRISSGFQRERYHPVLGKKRPHRGVDYAAASGTPIKAAGDGKVSYKGTKGGYGRTVIIQHGTQYSTLYGHMSRYARGISPGKTVRQGQIIGYVGKSGLATGPHLHYEFRLNGVHRNPLTVKLPSAEPIDKQYLDDFRQKTRGLVVQLDMLQENMLAENTF